MRQPTYIIVMVVDVPHLIDHSTTTRRPFYEHGLTLIPLWISNQQLSNVVDEFTHPNPYLIDCTAEIWEWISNFIN